jgi:hypothetical protein
MRRSYGETAPKRASNHPAREGGAAGTDRADDFIHADPCSSR